MLWYMLHKICERNSAELDVRGNSFSELLNRPFDLEYNFQVGSEDRLFVKEEEKYAGNITSQGVKIGYERLVSEQTKEMLVVTFFVGSNKLSWMLVVGKTTLTITFQRNEQSDPVFTELLLNNCPVKDNNEAMRNILKRVEETTSNFTIPSEHLDCRSLRYRIANSCYKSSKSGSHTKLNSKDTCYAFDLAMCMVGSIDQIHQRCRTKFEVAPLEEQCLRILKLYERFIILNYPTEVCKYM